MKKKLHLLANVLMTKGLTLLGFCSPLALMACYGAPVGDYADGTFKEDSSLILSGDTLSHTDVLPSGSGDGGVYTPGSEFSE